MSRSHVEVETGESRGWFETVPALYDVKVLKDASSRPITVFVVDEHVDSGPSLYLKSNDRTRVAGHARDVEEAIREVDRTFDVIVIDVEPIPDAVRKFRKAFPLTKLLVFTMVDDVHSMVRAVHDGAHGFISKATTTRELVRAIEVIYAGGTYFGPHVTRALMEEAARDRMRRNVELTRRELAVLTEVAKGCTSREVADRLHLSTKTVEAHREQIMKKLEIYTTAGLTRYAIANHIIEA